jgi:hypothetical protein
LSLTDDLTVADDATITDDLAVTGLATVGETLSVAGATNFLLDATAVTTHTTATAAMSGELISNIGATGGVTLTLPVAAEGLHFCLYTYAAQSFEINPDDADQIHHLTDAAGDAVRNGTAGDKICIIAIDATNWVPIEEHGTWTDVN